MKWKLQSLRIDMRQSYRIEKSENKCDYKGKIEFSNNKGDSFYFNISDEQMNEYIRLVSQEVVRTANELGDKISESFNTLPVEQKEE